ncbi:alpha/beta fold hydrolase [Streptomyces sp. NPDC006879]|uniref:alpha/beta fold hydrolase n=1 Tax=Streptomyces sp. NPDC006879 TaxID=3364767 RepID=UPI0036C6A520
MPSAPSAAVLVLHGGRADGLGPPTRLNLPRQRMRPFVRGLLKVAPSKLLVAQVRYRCRGWNGERQDPVGDVRQALEELRAAVGPLPVVLVGHSMGGRAALRAAADPAVRGVLGLAPWCPPGEPVGHLARTTVVLLHDEADRVTDARGTWEFLGRAREAGARVTGVAMDRGGHAMLRDARVWHRVAVEATTGLLGLAELPEEMFVAAVPVRCRADGTIAGPGAPRR